MDRQLIQDEVEVSNPELMSSLGRNVEILGGSKETLRSMVLNLNENAAFLVGRTFIHLVLDLPYLEEFRLFGNKHHRPQVQLIEPTEARCISSFHLSNLSPLRILRTSGSDELFNSHLSLLDNLTSLAVWTGRSHAEWRRILKAASRSRKPLFFLADGRRWRRRKPTLSPA